MNAVVRAETTEAAAPASFFAVIERMATNPSVDVDKLERLMQMHERMQAKHAEAEFSADLAGMQTELPSIGERGDAAGRYRFALWEDINAAIKPVLSRFGFALSFRTDFTDGIAVTGVLSHRSGHSERTTIKLPADASGNKNAVQAVASSVSYGKRYTAGALLNLTSHGEDDDAFTAGTTGQQFDITAWADAIKSATRDELTKIKADLLANKAIPDKSRKSIITLWNARLRELQK